MNQATDIKMLPMKLALSRDQIESYKRRGFRVIHPLSFSGIDRVIAWGAVPLERIDEPAHPRLF